VAGVTDRMVREAYSDQLVGPHEYPVLHIELLQLLRAARRQLGRAGCEQRAHRVQQLKTKHNDECEAGRQLPAPGRGAEINHAMRCFLRQGTQRGRRARITSCPSLTSSFPLHGFTGFPFTQTKTYNYNTRQFAARLTSCCPCHAALHARVHASALREHGSGQRANGCARA
jgi:hypothetical protein